MTAIFICINDATIKNAGETQNASETQNSIKKQNSAPHHPHDCIVGFEAQGHSGYAASGEDIVCAAISALTQACLLGLTQYVGIQPKVKQKDGYLRVCHPCDALQQDAQFQAIQAIFHTMAFGLESIALSCPSYLKITYRRCKHKCLK